jgi:hypothetical protein
MNFDPESILQELTGKALKEYPEMAIQSLLELVTITEYTQFKEKSIDMTREPTYMLTYEMGLFEEDELSILEKEYKNYLGFDKYEKRLKIQLS